MKAAFFGIRFKPDHTAHAIEALKEHCRTALAIEPGAKRHEFYLDPEDPNKIWFYEAFVDEAAIEIHIRGHESGASKPPPFVKKECDCDEEWIGTVLWADSLWTPEEEGA